MAHSQGQHQRWRSHRPADQLHLPQGVQRHQPAAGPGLGHLRWSSSSSSGRSRRSRLPVHQEARGDRRMSSDTATARPGQGRADVVRPVGANRRLAPPHPGCRCPVRAVPDRATSSTWPSRGGKTLTSACPLELSGRPGDQLPHPAAVQLSTEQLHAVLNNTHCRSRSWFRNTLIIATRRCPSPPCSWAPQQRSPSAGCDSRVAAQACSRWCWCRCSPQILALTAIFLLLQRDPRRVPGPRAWAPSGA